MAKKKKGKTDDFSLLEAGLTTAAEKKAKAKAKLEREKKEKEAKKVQDAQAAAAAARASQKISGNGIVDAEDMLAGHLDDEVQGWLNSAIEGDVASGLDAGLSSLKMGKDEADAHPEKKMKALHKAFEERMLPEMKESHPGLKLSQYKEKIFELWKKSPENPLNKAAAQAQP